MADELPAAKPRNDFETEDKSPFDLWLDRGLHRLFDEVAQEPIPEELLRLIDSNRDK